MVEPQPSKLMMWVRFPSPAPSKRYVGRLSVMAKVLTRPYSSVVEHFLGKEEVTGSSPVMGSRKKRQNIVWHRLTKYT